MAATDSLKVFAIAGRTNVAGTAADDVDQEELRMVVGQLLGAGYLPNATTHALNVDAFKVRQDTGANMSLKIGSGSTKVDSYVVQGTVAGQGSYLVRLDATTRTITVPAADATNPARYGVYLVINDVSYSGTAGRAYADVVCIRGTPAGSPVTPTALAAWSASVLLWEFQLAANATAVTNTILDTGTAVDRRRPAKPALPMPMLRWQRNTTQSVGPGNFDKIAFNVSLSSRDGFGAVGTDATVPAGMDGLWLVSYRAVWAGVGGNFLINYNTGSVLWETRAILDGAASGNFTGAMVLPLAVGDTVSITAYNNGAASQNVTSAFLDMARLSPFLL